MSAKVHNYRVVWGGWMIAHKSCDTHKKASTTNLVTELTAALGVYAKRRSQYFKI